MAQESRNSEQDTAGCQHSEGPVYCVNNCGLLGNPATMNLCSKCYLAMAVKEPDSFPSKVLAFPEDSLVLPTEIGKSMPNLDTDTIVSAVPKVGQTVKHDKRQQVELNDGSPQQAGPSIIQQHQHGSRLVNRCFTCNKRVGLTVFKCRCGDMFCSLHRYSDRHSCAYDYKAAARDSIAKANPLVHASKIEKI